MRRRPRRKTSLCLKVSIWPRSVLPFWYLYKVEISIPKEFFSILPLFHHEIKLQSSHLVHAPHGWPSA